MLAISCEIAARRSFSASPRTRTTSSNDDTCICFTSKAWAAMTSLAFPSKSLTNVARVRSNSLECAACRSNLTLSIASECTCFKSAVTRATSDNRSFSADCKRASKSSSSPFNAEDNSSTSPSLESKVAFRLSKSVSLLCSNCFKQSVSSTLDVSVSFTFSTICRLMCTSCSKVVTCADRTSFSSLYSLQSFACASRSTTNESLSLSS